MGDFWSRYNDAIYDQYIDGMIHDKVMENTKLQQCIFLFVEGFTEEASFPELLCRCGVDIDELGVIVANYNGIGNLLSSLRLLYKTLSHDRPVIVTLDNDADGRKFLNRFSSSGIDSEQIILHPIPTVVTPIMCSDGEYGGSYEELFPVDYFIEHAFSPEFLAKEVVDSKSEFMEIFDQQKSWFDQVRKFSAQTGHVDLKDYKIQLGEKLAMSCSEVPSDISNLAQKVLEVRDQYPVVHPESVAMESLRKSEEDK